MTGPAELAESVTDRAGLLLFLSKKHAFSAKKRAFLRASGGLAEASPLLVL
jgi:hypothetical protein